METYLGRKIKRKHEFNVDGTFESYHAACNWATENNYCAGSMDGHNPIALMEGFDYVAKWHNLSSKEREMVDGVMISECFREKPVTILIFE
jgi:hypothetical protein